MTKVDKIAIKVEGVSKDFKVPHEKSNSLKSSALSLLSLKKQTFEEFKALKDISFEVREGEFFGIVGRNGSGKSTLLKMLAGIYVPDKGKITVDGRISPFLELGVGFNPELTGRENVYLNGAILGLSRKEIDEKYKEIVEFAELEEFMDQKLKNYSSGMQVRLAFAVAIEAHAEILLIDEVLAVGDENFQRKCYRKFDEFKEAGKTIVFVSHSMENVRKYCNRCILLHNSEVYSSGDSNLVTRDYEKLNLLVSDTKKAEGGKGSVEIVSVRAINGNSSNIIQTGDDLIIEIVYKIKDKKIKNLNFAIGAHAAEGGHVFSYNTTVDKVNKLSRTGKIKLVVHNIPLLNGCYNINVNVYDDIEANFYDYQMQVTKFKISNKNQLNGGLMAIKHEWIEE